MNKQLFFGEIVKKDNDIIRTKIDIKTVEASNILASLISQIKTKEEEFQENYTINVSEFLSNASGRSYLRLKGFCQELLKTTAEIELKNVDTGQYEFYGLTFFTRISYSKGKITASFNPLMKHYLLQLKSHFTEINLFEFLTLSTKHSKRLFEILKSWSNLPECIIKLNELHRMLDIAESQKRDFREFRIKVLEPSQKEIIKKTKFFFEFEPIKKGVGKTSPVIAIKFIFAKNRALPIAKDKIKTAQKKEEQKMKIFKKAFYCAEQKKGICKEKNQPVYICKFCQKSKFCEQNLISEKQNNLFNIN